MDGHVAEGNWFTSRVRLAVLIEGEGAVRFADSVYVFTASDFDAALRRAVDLGRAAETTYTNADGEFVRWRLSEVLTLDQLGRGDLDGAEVYSEPVDLPQGLSIEFDHRFAPEHSQPGQTGIPPLGVD